MVVWLKPCKSRSSPGALSRKAGSERNRPFSLRLGIPLPAEWSQVNSRSRRRRRWPWYGRSATQRSDPERAPARMYLVRRLTVLMLLFAAAFPATGAVRTADGSGLVLDRGPAPVKRGVELRHPLR